MNIKFLILSALCVCQCALTMVAAEQPRTDREPLQLQAKAVSRVPYIINNTDWTIGWLSIGRSNTFLRLLGYNEEHIENHEVLIDDRNKIAPGGQYPFIKLAGCDHYVLNVCLGPAADWNVFEGKPILIKIALLKRQHFQNCSFTTFVSAKNVILSSDSKIYVNNYGLIIDTPGKSLATYQYN